MGYAWDEGKYAIRNIVENNHGLTFHATSQIVESIDAEKFPKQCMILAHRLWSDTESMAGRAFVFRTVVGVNALNQVWAGINQVFGQKLGRAVWGDVILNQAVAAAGLADSVTVDSCGTGGWHVGQGAD